MMVCFLFLSRQPVSLWAAWPCLQDRHGCNNATTARWRGYTEGRGMPDESLEWSVFVSFHQLSASYLISSRQPVAPGAGERC